MCDTLVNRDVIISEVDTALQVMVDGLVQWDAEKLFSIFRESSNSHYVRQGHIYPDIKTAEKQYGHYFAKSSSSPPRKFTFTQKHYDVLSGNAVLFTGLGAFDESGTGKADTKPLVIAYTILWIKENSEWKTVNMHISWEKN